MNRRDLEERIFDLIDDEARHPAEVLRAAASVPGGWWYFQRMKDALELANRLPVEEPPAHLDAGILAASARMR